MPSKSFVVAQTAGASAASVLAGAPVMDAFSIARFFYQEIRRPEILMMVFAVPDVPHTAYQYFP